MPPETLSAEREAEIRALFAQQALMAEIGVAIAHVGAGAVDLALRYDPRFTQQKGFVHGGVVGMVVDTACGFAAATLFPTGTDVVTVEYKINFLRPAEGERFVARGRVLRAGRRVSVVEGRFVALRADGETAVAAMLATMAPVAR